MRHRLPGPRRRLAVLASAAVLAPGAAPAQADATRALAPGVTYRRLADPAGPWEMHLVRVDLRRGGAALRAVRANDSLRGRETVSAMVRRTEAGGARVLAAVNADFFSLDTGENENEQVLAGEWWKGLPVTDSPYDSYDNAHVQFALDRDGESVAERSATLEGTISRNAEVRHPRTALGFSRDSTVLLLLVVDGRSRRSVGMTLVELARVMRRLGAWQAMNFDGGGSTTMVVDGALVNAPSDSLGERAVGNAVLVVRSPSGRTRNLP